MHTRTHTHITHKHLHAHYCSIPHPSLQVRAKVLDLISSDPGAQQTELVLLGTFGRAARLISAAAEGKGSNELAGGGCEI